MTQRGLGDTLKARRHELGCSIEAAAQATNLRERVLDVFENGDYASYPPAGHVEGMLSSYASFLGLDQRLVLDMYHREKASYDERSERKAAASQAKRGLGRFGESRESGVLPKTRTAATTGSLSAEPTDRLAQEHLARNDDRYKSGSVKVVSRSASAAPRRFAGQRSAAAGPARVRAYGGNANARPSQTGAARYGEQAGATPRRATGTASRQSSAPGAHEGERTPAGVSGRLRTRRRRDGRSEARAVEEAQPGVIGRATAAVSSIFKETRTRLIALAAILLIIVVAIAANLLISTAGNSGSDVIEVQGGAENTTKTNTKSKEATATITTANGNPVSVHIEVAEGSTSLVNVTFDDDEAYKGIAVGPWTRDFLVSESMAATFGNPDAVTVTENGTEVEIEKDDDGTGHLTLKIKSTNTASDESDGK